MLCSQFSQKDIRIWDGSSRAISPCVFLSAHYERLLPTVEKMLRRFGKKLTDMEGAEVMNELYYKFAQQESVGVWSPPSVAMDADGMSTYILGTAKKMILGWNAEKFEYQEVNVNTPCENSAVDEVLEKREQALKREKILEDVTTLLLSLGIDAEELYSQTREKEFDAVGIQQLHILFGVCCTTKEEWTQLRALYDNLQEIET